MLQKTQEPSTNNNPDPPALLPPLHHEPLSAMLKLLQEQAHERRLSAVSLAARLLRECGGSLKARRERAQVTVLEALRLAQNSGGNYCSSRRGSSSTPLPSTETAAHSQNLAPPERGGINRGVRTGKNLSSDHEGSWRHSPVLEGNGEVYFRGGGEKRGSGVGGEGQVGFSTDTANNGVQYNASVDRQTRSRRESRREDLLSAAFCATE